MSNTYGSININTHNCEQVTQTIINEYMNIPNEHEEMLTALHRLNLHRCDDWLVRYAQIDQDQFLVVVTDGWVSLYNDQMSLEDVTKKARFFAKKTQEPVVYMSCFDGDVYVFGLIEDGKTKTSGRAVVDPDVYAMTEKQAKMAEFYRIAGVPMPDKRMKMPSDVSELEELLASIMPVPLIVYDENDFKSLAEEYELIEEVRGIRVFKVKYKK